MFDLLPYELNVNSISDLNFTPLEIMPRCSAAGLGFIIIPAGFNAPAGISNGVYISPL